MSEARHPQVSEPTTLHEVKTLILALHPVVAVETFEEERLEKLMESVGRDLAMPLFEWSVTSGLRKRGQKVAFHATTQPLTLLKHMAGLSVEGVFLLKDFVPHLQQLEVRRQFREVAQSFSHSRSTIVLSGLSVDLPSDVRHLAVQYRLRLPSREELRDEVRKVLQSLRKKAHFRIDLGPDDLEQLLQALGGFTLKQARQVLGQCILSDGKLDRDDIGQILERKGESIRDQGILEYYPARSNQYKLGGFQNLRNWLTRARIGFSARARELNLAPPRGILLAGVQGCGKSLAAKFVAGEWGLPLLKLDASRLYDKYVGESEKNFRKATAQAEAMAPAVLWIDEIEKGFAVGSSGADGDGGVSMRILGAFLTWMQEKKATVFVVATANDLERLPPEFLRKGRFDEIFFVDLPDRGERKSIFEIHLELRKQDPGRFEIARLVDQTEGFSGAEIEQVVIAALYRALYQEKPLSTDLIGAEIEATVPLSVSRREQIDSLRQTAAGRFVNVH